MNSNAAEMAARPSTCCRLVGYIADPCNTRRSDPLRHSGTESSRAASPYLMRSIFFVCEKLPAISL